LQNGVELSSQKGGWIVMLEMKRDVTADDRRREHRAGRRLGIHLNLDGEDLIGMWGQAEVVQKAREADKSTVDRPLIIRPNFNRVPLLLQV
jgi:hypothetical protein